ncbi:MAG: hypothetical protein HUJ56_01895 [Erysipelotrichaceae bacterium]|nr:hypothetical protein [Erysipelotrichaceae bacterium]
MANICNTDYIITGSPIAMETLYDCIVELDKKNNGRPIWYGDMCEELDIDREKLVGVSTAGSITFFEKDDEVLTLVAESKWSSCNLFWDEVNHKLDDELSISFREIEPGMGIYNVHDEGGYFDEQCCVDSQGEPFEEHWNDVYTYTQDAVDEWCRCMGKEQGDRSLDEMINYINTYEYNEEDTYFYINEFEEI